MAPLEVVRPPDKGIWREHIPWIGTNGEDRILFKLLESIENARRTFGQAQVPLRSCASAKNMSFHDAGRCFRRPTLCMNAMCFIRLAGAVV